MPGVHPAAPLLMKAPPNEPCSLTNALKLPLCFAKHLLPWTQLNSIVLVSAQHRPQAHASSTYYSLPNGLMERFYPISQLEAQH